MFVIIIIAFVAGVHWGEMNVKIEALNEGHAIIHPITKDFTWDDNNEDYNMWQHRLPREQRTYNQPRD